MLLPAITIGVNGTGSTQSIPSNGRPTKEPALRFVYRLIHSCGTGWSVRERKFKLGTGRVRGHSCERGTRRQSVAPSLASSWRDGRLAPLISSTFTAKLTRLAI